MMFLKHQAILFKIYSVSKKRKSTNPGPMFKGNNPDLGNNYYKDIFFNSCVVKALEITLKNTTEWKIAHGDYIPDLY